MTDAFGGYDPGPVVENNEPSKPSKPSGDGDRSIRDRISDDVAAGFDKATTVVGSHASDIMGSTMGGLVDDIKNLTTGAFDLVAGSMKTMFGFGKNTIEEDQLDQSEEQTSLLGKILNIFKLQSLEDRRATGSDKGILYDILAMAGITLALILAPFVAIAGFFEGLMSAWEMIKFPTFKRLFSPITNLFVKLKNLFTIGTEGTVIEKYMLKLKGGISKIGGFFKMIGGFFKMIFVGFKNTLPFFGKILQFSKFLGRILGTFTGILPIILGVWDGIMGAIKGFKETDGSMFEKIMGGIKGALVGIIKGMITIPLDLLKDLTSWLLSKFGFEDVAATLDSFSFSKLFTDAFEGFFNLVKKILDFDLTSLLPDRIKKWMGIKDKEKTKEKTKVDSNVSIGDKNYDASQRLGHSKQTIRGSDGNYNFESYKLGQGEDSKLLMNEQTKQGKLEYLNKQIANAKEDIKSYNKQDDFFKSDREESKLDSKLNKAIKEYDRISKVEALSKDEYVKTITAIKDKKREISKKELTESMPEKVSKTVKESVVDTTKQSKMGNNMFSLPPSPIARPMQSMSEVSNNPLKSDRMTSIEIKNMSDRLDKTLREMMGGQEQNNQNQTQINQTLVNTNNTVMSGRNNIPEESSLISVQMFNGAGM